MSYKFLFVFHQHYEHDSCFSKNDKAYWGSGGSPEEMSRDDLPGVQERIWCEREVVPGSDPEGGGGNPSGGGDGLNGNSACMTENDCAQMRFEMDIDSFRVGTYPTKG